MDTSKKTSSTEKKGGFLMEELKKIIGYEEDEIDPGFSNGIMAFLIRLVEYVVSFIKSYIPMPL